MPNATTYTSKLRRSTALVLGGTSGLGFGVAAALLEHGASHIIISSSSSDRVQQAVKRLEQDYPDSIAGGAKVSGVVCDLGDAGTLERQVQGLFGEVKRLLGLKEGKKGLDHVVFSAGDRLAELPIDEWSVEAAIKAGNVRFFAPLMVAKHARSVLKERGSITLTTGAVGEIPVPGWSLVAGYAAGLAGMTRNLALDLKPIRVNLISPGGVDTELWDPHGPEKKQEIMDMMAKKTTTGRIGRVEDVVETYLCAMKDQNMSGTILRSDGGWSVAP